MYHFTVDLNKDYPQLTKAASTPLIGYIPANSAEIAVKQRPAIIVFPGGGYEFLSDREAEPIALAFAAQGYCSFILKYAVKPAVYPLQLFQAMAAIDYIKKNAEEYHVDKNKIAVIGFSAGGHAAASAATLHSSQEVLKAFDVKENELRPDAAILSYPVISNKEFAHKGSLFNVSGGDNQVAEYLSLEKRVDKNTSPCFLWHTADDGCVPVKNSLVFAEKLSEYSVPFELHVFEKGVHGLSLANQLTNSPNCNMINQPVSKWLELSLNWLALRGFTLDK